MLMDTHSQSLILNLSYLGMKTRYKYRVIILLAGIIFLSFTKDERDIIGRINNTYSNFKNISMDIECKVYSNNGKKLEVSYKGVYKKQGYMIYHDLMDNLQISNTNGQMILDRNNKFISVSTD